MACAARVREFRGDVFKSRHIAGLRGLGLRELRRVQQLEGEARRDVAGQDRDARAELCIRVLAREFGVDRRATATSMATAYAPSMGGS